MDRYAASLLEHFSYEHLSEGRLRETSRRFALLAHELVDDGMAGMEATVALRKLLEAKDAAVRATRVGRCLPIVEQHYYGERILDGVPVCDCGKSVATVTTVEAVEARP